MYLVFWFGKLITRSTSLSWISLQQNGKIQNYGNYNLVWDSWFSSILSNWYTESGAISLME